MRIPHISSLLDNDLDQIIKDSEIIVLGNQDESFSSLVRDVPADKRLLDLVGFMPQRSANNLEGICW
jgi:GDP-mannose 6-dehydrogenase